MAAWTALLLTLTAGPALAAIPNTTDQRNASTPMITGTAMLVNEHQLLVKTEQGEEVLLSLDSRTMVPADLDRGMMMRVEFKYLEDGSRLAERIIPIREGQKTTRELAYANEREEDQQVAAYASSGPAEEHAEARMSHAGSVTNRPLGTPLRAVPATMPYRIATEPMLTGEVATVNDHRIVIDTDQGHPVPVEMDSRTLIPTDLQTGIGVRVEYKSLEDGTKLATRITEIPNWVGNGNEARETAYEQNRETAENEAMPASMEHSSMRHATAVNEQNENERPAMTEAAHENAARRLPDTASNEPLIALLGLAALASAGALAMGRRFRAS